MVTVGYWPQRCVAPCRVSSIPAQGETAALGLALGNHRDVADAGSRRKRRMVNTCPLNHGVGIAAC